MEVDETYIGGRRRMGKGQGRANKKTVMGIIQRGGDIRLEMIQRTNHETMHGFVRQYAPNPQRIMTDEHIGYHGIGDADTTHETVSHQAKEYVRGDVTTNSIESAFGLFKRAMVGAFHQVSEKHLDRYLDEFEFRFNNRKNPYLFRDTITRLVHGEALPYEKLTA